MTDILCKWLNDELTISQQVGKNSIFFKYHFDLHKHKNDMHAHIKLDLIDTEKNMLKGNVICSLHSN